MFDKVPNMPRGFNIPGFWIYLGNQYPDPVFWKNQDSEYTRFTQGPKYARIIPEYSWLYLNMPQTGFWICQVYTGSWLCLNMPKYAGICLSMPKSARMTFALHDPIVIPCLLEWVVTYFNEAYSLKEHNAVFVKRQNLIFL